MKKFFILTLLTALAAIQPGAVTLKEKYGSFSVIGDSYSTFMGFTDPIDNAQWYPHAGNAMASVEQTWWKLFENATGISLEHNNSYSGSTICTHSWNNSTDLANSFVGRVGNLREAGLIIVEGATNDNNAGSTLGEYVWSDFTAAQKRTFRGGTAYVIDFLQQKYPDSQIIFMLNSDLRADINESVAVICGHYGVPLLRLHDITKIDEHPDAPGMIAIKEQLIEMLCELNGMIYISEHGDVSVSEEKKDVSLLVDKHMKAGRWNSVCFPFGMDAGSIAGHFGNGTRVQKAISFNDNIIEFKECDAIEPNIPCLVMPSTDVNEPFCIANTTLARTEPVALGQENVLTGIYSPATPGTTRKPVYSFSAYATPYSAVGQNIEFLPLSVVVKCQGTTKPEVSVDNYTPPTTADLSYEHAFTPVHTHQPIAGAVPVITSDPFLNVWSHGNELTSGCMRHISGAQTALDGYIQVDDELYRFIGEGNEMVVKRITGKNAETAVARQTRCVVTATQTYCTYMAGAAEVTVVFTTPLLVDDASTFEAAVSYISYQARSTDGIPHEVGIHIAPSADIVRRYSSDAVTAYADESEGVTFGKIGCTIQNMSEGNRANWGYLLLMADAARHQKMTANSQYLLFTDNLGTVTAPVTGYTLIGRDENRMSVGFGYARFPSPWTLRHRTFQQLMLSYAADVNHRLEACREFDQMICDDANRCGGDDYARLCESVYRQVVSSCRQAVSDTGSILLYNIDAGNSWQISQADQLYAAAPLFLAYNPELAYSMFEAVPDYISMYPWFSSPYGNAPHHLGTWPVMAGDNLDMGVDSTTDLCILAGAAVMCGMNAAGISVNSYTYLTSLCDYLDLFTLPQYINNFPNESSADGHIRDNASLRLKSVIAMELVSQIAGKRGNAADQTFYHDMALRWENIFRSSFNASDHYRQGESVEWGTKYPLFYDSALGLGMFDDVIQTELAYYEKIGNNTYGMPLDARSESDAKVSALMLTAAMSDNFSSMAAPVIAYASRQDNSAPIADAYDCVTGVPRYGSGSAALGSVWGKVLMTRLGLAATNTLVVGSHATTTVSTGVYDLTGRHLSSITHPGIYIIDGKKTVIR